MLNRLWIESSPKAALSRLRTTLGVAGLVVRGKDRGETEGSDTRMERLGLLYTARQATETLVNWATEGQGDVRAKDYLSLDLERLGMMSTNSLRVKYTALRAISLDVTVAPKEVQEYTRKLVIAALESSRGNYPEHERQEVAKLQRDAEKAAVDFRPKDHYVAASWKLSLDNLRKFVGIGLAEMITGGACDNPVAFESWMAPYDFQDVQSKDAGKSFPQFEAIKLSQYGSMGHVIVKELLPIEEVVDAKGELDKNVRPIVARRAIQGARRSPNLAEWEAFIGGGELVFSGSSASDFAREAWKKYSHEHGVKNLSGNDSQRHEYRREVVSNLLDVMEKGNWSMQDVANHLDQLSSHNVPMTARNEHENFAYVAQIFGGMLEFGGELDFAKGWKDGVEAALMYSMFRFRNSQFKPEESVKNDHIFQAWETAANSIRVPNELASLSDELKWHQ